MMENGSSPVVLLVEDEEEVAVLYNKWLENEDYVVRLAYSGQEAIDMMDDDVDVALLDRRMPGMSGDEALEEIRGMGYDLPVGVVTATEPDFDIIKMDLDYYVTKPVSREELVETVAHLYARSDYDSALEEYSALVSKKAALEAQAHKPREELENSEEYKSLVAEIEEMRSRLDSVVGLSRDIDSIATIDFDDE